jgi:thiol:disulfide interchange protein/DsbC/DsbD-like thiol-disulfide interchange protein
MRLFRPLFILALLGILLTPRMNLRASDALPEPSGGRSATVTQPHVTAELIAETPNGVLPFDVALHLHMDPDWHTYWINPGEAGLATTIKWTLPPGWTAGPIRWPTPEVHAMGPVTTYGYGGDVYLLTKISPPQILTGHFPEKIDLKAKIDWLVCQEECIPGKADLALTLETNVGKTVAPDSVQTAFFAAARARLPVPNTRWDVAAAYQIIALNNGAPNALVVQLREKRAPQEQRPVGHLEFFAEQSNVLAAINNFSPGSSTDDGNLDVVQSLQQNGEKPGKLSGVLISDVPLIGNSKAVYLSSFPINASPFAVRSRLLTPNSAAPSADSSASATSTTPFSTSGTTSTPSNAPGTDTTSPSVSTAAPFLPAVLAFAFLGGLILNLMPCVLPVLSLKVFSLIRHAGENPGGAWKQGVAFTAGVVISFWILAGLLIALESAGNHLGWGFQMQSPGFVLALTFLFFLLALNLFGVFELGASLVGLDAKATSHLGGLPSSFANGALATLAATPCTAPFMGSAVGFAAQQPAAISLLVFTFLALGMAAPYLALTTFPGALRLVPKPGRWMEALRQFMGFLLMGTVIFLVYVFGALVGTDDVPMLLGTLLLAALAAWIFGRGTTPVHGTAMRFVSTLVALLLLGAAVAEGARLSYDVPGTSSSTTPSGWQAYSPDAVQAALKQGHPVFVDFTAAWCLSCKVNEQVALDIDSTKKAFAQKHVALFRGDWTHSDPEISKTLREFNRDGVPLYLLYSPRNPATPQVLPEVLTPGIVQDALQKVP